MWNFYLQNKQSNDYSKYSIESYATEVAEKAVIFSKHAKRRTIKASDVKLASKTK